MDELIAHNQEEVLWCMLFVDDLVLVDEGCQELLKLGGLAAIIEGDSFLAIQWGSTFQEDFISLEIGRLGGGGA